MNTLGIMEMFHFLSSLVGNTGLVDWELGYGDSNPTSRSNLLCDLGEVTLTSLSLGIFIWKLTGLA